MPDSCSAPARLYTTLTQSVWMHSTAQHSIYKHTLNTHQLSYPPITHNMCTYIHTHNSSSKAPHLHGASSSSSTRIEKDSTEVSQLLVSLGTVLCVAVCVGKNSVLSGEQEDGPQRGVGGADGGSSGNGMGRGAHQPPAWQLEPAHNIAPKPWASWWWSSSSCQTAIIHTAPQGPS